MSEPRFLITRLSHIGDCLLTLPLAAELRRQFPRAFIAWASEGPAAKLLRMHPDVDEVVAVPKKWFRNPRQWWSLRRQLKSLRVDVALDPQGLLKSSLLGRLSGAPRRIGFHGEYGREGSAVLNNVLLDPQQEHLVDRTLELLQCLELPRELAPANLRLPVPDSVLQSQSAFLKSLTFPCFCVLNPGASWPSKQWDTSRFGEVATYLFESLRLVPVVTWSGPEESMMADQIVLASRGVAIKAPHTSLPELAAILSQAEFFIGCDTGPLHLAAAVGTPCIGLYGPTLPQRSGAYGTQHIAVQKRFQDGSRRERRGATNEAMLEILAADVMHAIDHMLERLAPRKCS